MKKFAPFFILVILIAGEPAARSQDRLCQVVSKNLNGKYVGNCKNGLAEGQGEVSGIDHYSGDFKDGMPDGKGTYYYADTAYFKGNFQAGVREGRGEMHMLHTGHADAITKGYWSGDIYRGEKYSPYKLTVSSFFDRIEVIPSDKPGNTVTFEVATTSGSPNGAPTHATNTTFSSGYVLTITDLSSPTGSILKTGAKFASSFKSSTVYELTGFPCQLVGMFSNGEVFQLDLYKAANWKVRFFVNK
jgi:hypothetical protein